MSEKKEGLLNNVLDVLNQDYRGVNVCRRYAKNVLQINYVFYQPLVIFR